MTDAEERRVEILYLCYWEHFKHASDLAKVLPSDHPKRIKMWTAADEILKEIHKITGQKNEKHTK